MTKPIHVQAFERLAEEKPDRLRALVAFALFVEAEFKWANGCNPWPTIPAYQKYHSIQLADHEISDLEKSADNVLRDFAQEVVEIERAEILDEALKQYRIEAAKPHKSFWKGVLEATVGALVWSLVLILMSIILSRLNIDILEAYKKAAGIP
ncbi:MAG TPA: hypothetical protein VII40_06305 [Xanthobacteraceae bacterium]